MTPALIVVDVQNDFCEGGSLPVRGGHEVAARITRLIGAGEHHPVVATRDHHVDPGEHFSAAPDYVATWPPHCVAGTPGADLAPGLDSELLDAVFFKGARAAAYSGFEGSTDPEQRSGRGLAEWLREQGVSAVDVVGLATDHCVAATALDAVANGFTTRVLLEFAAGVAETTTAAAIERMAAAGVTVVPSPGEPAPGEPAWADSDR